MIESADLFEVYRRLAGNPEDAAFVLTPKSLPVEVEIQRLRPGSIINVDGPVLGSAVLKVPWYRLATFKRSLELLPRKTTKQANG